MHRKTPSVSIILPVHNEEAILAEQAARLIDTLAELGLRFELLLVENGSSDGSLDICKQLEADHPGVRTLVLPVGDYGVALQHGILNATNEVVVVFNVEFWSIEFVEIALAALRSRTLVIGSKSAPGADDERPLLRRTITAAYNVMLKVLWGFDGTDTHGMKAFWRLPLLPVVESCQTRSWVFDTEMVLRAQRAGITRIELPTNVREVRSPSNISLFRRVPSVLGNLWQLWKTLSLAPLMSTVSNQVLPNRNN